MRRQLWKKFSLDSAETPYYSELNYSFVYVVHKCFQQSILLIPLPWTARIGMTFFTCLSLDLCNSRRCKSLMRLEGLAVSA